MRPPCQRCGDPVPKLSRRLCDPCEAERVAPKVGAVPRSRRKRIHEYRLDHCEECGWTPPTVLALDVDHVVPRSEGGTDDPSNLRTLCPTCHRLKTLAERGLIAA